MNSLFDLKDRKDDLTSANMGLADLFYDQMLPLRNVTDGPAANRFGNGVITFRFQLPAGQWWIPGKSYFKLKCSLTRADDTQLHEGDNVAPNMGLCSNLFQKMKFKMNDKDITEISEHCAEIDALKTRLSKPREWLKTIGTETNWWEHSFEKRRNAMIGAGYNLDDLFYVPAELGQFPNNTIDLLVAGT